VPVVALHRHVEPRTQPLDEAHLEEQRGELARRVVPVDVHRLADDARAFVLGIAAAKIAQEARAQPLRFADVHHLAAARVHPIYARPVLGARGHRGAHARELVVVSARREKGAPLHR